MKDIHIIAAMSRNRVIGTNNKLPWLGRMRADMIRFKRLTMGHVVVMGRRTYESIGHPLPGRRIVILSRQMTTAPDGVSVASSLDEVVPPAGVKIFVAGGANVYRQTLAYASVIYLTLIDADFEGDAFFPELDENIWKKIGCEEYSADKHNAWNYIFLTYRTDI